MKITRRERIEYRRTEDGDRERVETGRYSRMRTLEKTDLPERTVIRDEIRSIVEREGGPIRADAVADIWIRQVADRLSPPLAPDEEDAGFVGDGDYSTPFHDRTRTTLNWLAEKGTLVKWGQNDVRMPTVGGWRSPDAPHWATAEAAALAGEWATAVDVARQNAEDALTARVAAAQERLDVALHGVLSVVLWDREEKTAVLSLSDVETLLGHLERLSGHVARVQ